jgi:hypothetical protein
LNGTVPVTMWYASTPIVNTSARGFGAPPIMTSGAKYGSSFALASCPRNSCSRIVARTSRTDLMPADDMTIRSGSGGSEDPPLRISAGAERRLIMSGLTPLMNPPLACSAAAASSACRIRARRRSHGNAPPSAIACLRTGTVD